ncbi:MAG: Lipid biosynthesis lauroyl acyltransferase [Pseudomonadota bacterium]
MVNLLIALMRLFARLPLSWVRAAGSVLGWLLWHFAHMRRRVVLVNLQQCMPELSPAEHQALAYRHFKAFGQSVLDRSWLWHAPEDTVRQRLRWVGDVQALHTPGPLVMFAPHFVGLDAGGMAVSLGVAGPVAFIFVGQSSPKVSAWVNQGRERSGNVRPYFRHQGMRQILAGIKKGEPLHLSPDMDFGRSESIFVPFMGVEKAATVPSLSRLSKVAGARVVPVVTRMTDAGYDIEVHAPLTDFPSDDMVQDTVRMNRLLAEWVRSMPEQYYWVHKRLKTRPEGESSFY